MAASGLRMPEWQNAQVSTGTSLVACEFKDGVIIGADSRTSTGPYVNNRVTDKVNKLTEYIYCARCGSAADTQAVIDLAAYHLKLYMVEMGEDPLVKTAAHIFQQLCYGYRDSVVAGITLAGWDKTHGGQIYSIPCGGSMQRENLSIDGSGSDYVCGYVDAHFKTNMPEGEAVQFVVNTLALAMGRDASSGGVIRLAVIMKTGVKRILVAGDQLPKFDSL